MRGWQGTPRGCQLVLLNPQRIQELDQSRVKDDKADTRQELSATTAPRLTAGWGLLWFR